MKEINSGKVRENANSAFLKRVTEPLLIINGKTKEKLAVLVSYKHYLMMAAVMDARDDKG